MSTATVILMAVAACTGVVRTPSAIPAPIDPTDAAASAAATTPARPQPSQDVEASPLALTQAWATAELVDVASGEPFRIGDHVGKVIIVETMAIWCSNCRAQQREVQAALDRLPVDSVVYVVLDVDPNEDDASLALYRERNDFGGRYAIAGNDVARALAADFGDQFLNPVATPMIVVGPGGTVILTEFGPKLADEIVALARAAEA